MKHSYGEFIRLIAESRTGRISENFGEKMRFLTTMIPFAIAMQVSFPAIAQSSNQLQSELDLVLEQVEQANSVINRYDGGLIRALAETRKEALLLSEAVLRNRILAEQGRETVEIIIPAVQPDEAKASQILGEIADAQRRIDEAEREAAKAGGLIQAVALSRVETEKLTLAQLQMAYFQAKYGIAFPTVADANPQDHTSGRGSASEVVPDAEATDALPWADSRFPDIDYSIQPFEQAHNEGNTISGWWTIATERAAVDDSPKVTAVNYSQFNPSSYAGITALLARCNESDTALIFLQDDYLLSDFRRNSFDITYRIDNQPAQQTRWSSLTSSKGAGLFGREAEQFIRQIYDADQLFIRLVEKNGQRHDATFDLSGGRDAYEDVASACGWTTLSLTSDDYRAIQTLLNAGGFDAGTPDGQWGPGSQRAMREFQASIGLPESGAPDRDTLGKLGFGG